MRELLIIGLGVGNVAELVVAPGDTVSAAVMDRAPRTMVIKDGAVVAQEGTLV